MQDPKLRSASGPGVSWSEPDVTVIIPVFNDLHSLEIAIPRSIEILSRITNEFELIIAEDGSTDGSAELVRQYEQRDTRIHLLHSDERLGRGKALNRAIYEPKGTSSVIMMLILQLICSISPNSLVQSAKGQILQPDHG